MAEFDHWLQWGRALSEKEFANAFVALGLLAASGRADDSGVDTSIPLDIDVVLLRQLQGAIQQRGSRVDWSYPRRDTRVQVGNRQITLSDSDPKTLAQSWDAALTVLAGAPLCLRVRNYPSEAPMRSWVRLFFEADPPQTTVSLVLETPDSALHLQWPLRIGYLPGNVSDESLNIAGSLWPLNTLTKAARIDRSNANCDVLIFNGSSSLLRHSLAALPVPMKCNMILLRGQMDEQEDVAVAASRNNASGLVFIPPDVTDDVMVNALNVFIENLSHNQPFDAALSSAFAVRYPTDPVIALSPRLSDFRLEHLVEKMHARLRAMPPRSRVPVPAQTLERMGMAGAVPGVDIGDAGMLEKTLAGGKSAISFKAARTGASGLAEVNRAIERAEEPKAALQQRAQRFLQQRAFSGKGAELKEGKNGLRQNDPVLLRVRIGPADEMWSSLKGAFPEAALPQDLDFWRLAVVLTEPNHLAEPLRGEILLPKDGPSTECDFSFVPGNHDVFEGRITVLHRGRVLQTAVLKAFVAAEGSAIPAGSLFDFTELVPVRSNIGDLEGRRQYDAAFVLNHTSDARPRLTAIAANHAWLSDLTGCQDIVMDINGELTKVAESVKDYSGGLDNEENVKVLVKLAQIGRQLYGRIVLDQIEDADNQASFAGLEYLQIVSTKSDALMPLEFIYTAVAPNDNAILCPNVAAALQGSDNTARHAKTTLLIEGTCQDVDRGLKSCVYRTTEHVCPMGFWGISKVIERHMTTPRLAQAGADFFLQSEPTTLRGELNLTGTAVVAASQKVKRAEVSPLLATCAAQLGAPPQEATDWSKWVQLVQTCKPHILLALPHTDGNGAHATMEINGTMLSSGQITADHVHPAGETTYPLVALIGCDTAGTALDYGDHVSWFRRGGAALVISTIAKVFGGHAAAVAEQLVTGLKQDTGGQERIGEIIRRIKRQALVDGSLMALCVVAFGDADWKLNGKE